jgi:hypothetical protein
MHGQAAVTRSASANRRDIARSRAGSKVKPDKVHAFLQGVVGEDFHAKRVFSLADGVVGVLHAATLGVHAIGRGLAAARNLDPKHAIKQVDRLLSNSGLELPVLLAAWVRFVVGVRENIVVALDWTEFDGDDQSVLALYLVSKQGRATPLLWKCVRKSALKGNRANHEFAVVEALHEALPINVSVTLLADRGFGDIKFYKYLDGLGWNYVVRFREGIHVKHKEETKRACDWLHANGRARKLVGAQVTEKHCSVASVVLVHAKKMKDAWCLASSLEKATASQIVALYGRRFTIEETFRDTKDIRFGMGLSATHINKPARRERILFLGAVAHVLLTLLGEAGERGGLDRKLKANTSKKRTLSLYRQGCYWYDAIAAMDDQRLKFLMDLFDQVLREQAIFSEIFGVI